MDALHSTRERQLPPTNLHTTTLSIDVNTRSRSPLQALSTHVYSPKKTLSNTCTIRSLSSPWLPTLIVRRQRSRPHPLRKRRITQHLPPTRRLRTTTSSFHLLLLPLSHLHRLKLSRPLRSRPTSVVGSSSGARSASASARSRLRSKKTILQGVSLAFE